MTYSHTPPSRHLSINTLAREGHEAARREGAYNGVPQYDKAWGELTAAERRSLSRSLVQALVVANQRQNPIPFNDEYSSPKPGEPGFVDPNSI